MYIFIFPWQLNLINIQNYEINVINLYYLLKSLLGLFMKALISLIIWIIYGDRKYI